LIVHQRWQHDGKAVDVIKDEDITFLLAVGGGSVIDATKFIAAAALKDGDAWDILTSGGAAIEKAMPFGTVLTLPATASEMNANSVITNPEKGAKLPFRSAHCFPVFSILDPEVKHPAVQAIDQAAWPDFATGSIAV
jgi:NADP-dependent alcohol dehydrogenase